MPYSLVDRYQCFERTCCLHLQTGKAFFLNYGGSRFFENADTYLYSVNLEDSDFLMIKCLFHQERFFSFDIIKSMA
jgi:hypothetical protein